MSIFSFFIVISNTLTKSYHAFLSMFFTNFEMMICLFSIVAFTDYMGWNIKIFNSCIPGEVLSICSVTLAVWCIGQTLTLRTQLTFKGSAYEYKTQYIETSSTNSISTYKVTFLVKETEILRIFGSIAF